jgi:hypothetical protein
MDEGVWDVCMYEVIKLLIVTWSCIDSLFLLAWSCASTVSHYKLTLVPL